MRFLYVCNLVGILGVSNFRPFQNGVWVPTPMYPLLLTLHPSFLPRKGKILGMKGSVLIKGELDVALGIQLFKDSHKTFVPPAQGMSPQNNIPGIFLKVHNSNRMV